MRSFPFQYIALLTRSRTWLRYQSEGYEPCSWPNLLLIPSWIEVTIPKNVNAHQQAYRPLLKAVICFSFRPSCSCCLFWVSSCSWHTRSSLVFSLYVSCVLTIFLRQLRACLKGPVCWLVHKECHWQFSVDLKPIFSLHYINCKRIQFSCRNSLWRSVSLLL